MKCILNFGMLFWTKSYSFQLFKIKQGSLLCICDAMTNMPNHCHYQKNLEKHVNGGNHYEQEEPNVNGGGGGQYEQ